ncbi:nitrate ABC transporter permease [Bacillus coahuilensis p1.1.43]|uniref:Nitrate ABC transporter permease n=1 Tax=Bacillus coahuilensis p1.1.43 TaxID=1150625 RepID=A0A147KAV9_9BACI|nr:ABC transporter permease [Bacillus coahuilensis]KUP07873.1 nitrate ABC transporter permease [Bacillus coahuilensis p1.1.43]
MKHVAKKSWRPTVVLLLLFIFWEISTVIWDIPAWMLPAPSSIIQEFFSIWDSFKEDVWSTSYLTFMGFIIGCSIGIVTSILLHLVPSLREAFYPLLILSQNIPIIVLAPLLVIWFGFGLLPKIIVITLVCFFPVAVATLDGLRQTPDEYLHYMKMAGATKRQIFWKVEVPSSLPSLFSGLKISATYSVMGAVISEWLGAKAGIGVFMTLASSSFRTDRVFVAIFLIMILSMVFFSIILFLEKLFIKGKGEPV